MKASQKNDPAQMVFPVFCPVVTATGAGTFSVELGRPFFWLSPRQFAAEFGLDRDSIYRWIAEGKIPAEFLQAAGFRRWRISSAAVAVMREKFRRERGL